MWPPSSKPQKLELFMTPVFRGERLAELAKLKDGWYNGEGTTLKPAEVDLVAQFLKQLVWQYGILPPYIYPIPDGGLRAEWTIGDWEISLIFDFVSDVLTADAVNTKTEASEDFQHSFKEENSFRKALERVGQFILRFD